MEVKVKHQGMTAKVKFRKPRRNQSIVRGVHLSVNDHLLDNKAILENNNGIWKIDLGTSGAIRAAATLNASREDREQLIEKINYELTILSYKGEG